jgi:peptidoglycan/xylan/chitin deacetylase (PgdA/CDA1 family)
MGSARVLSIFWHTVESNSRPPDSWSPSAHLFTEHIKFLLKSYTPISILEFLQIHEKKRLIHSYPKPPLLMGFDDGFKNVLRYALPILEEFKAPALFFVIGEILRNPQFVPWYVERRHLIRKAVKKTVVYGNKSMNLGVRQDALRLMRLFDASFRMCTTESERQTVLTNFAEILGVDRPQGHDLDDDLKFVDRNDLTNLSSSSLLTVGSHAMSHRDLVTLSYKEQVEELEQSDFLLQQQCPSYYPVIAYPGGSFNNDTIDIASRIYKAGFAVLLGASYRGLYAFPRIGLGNDSVEEVSYSISRKRRNYLLPLIRVLHLTGIRPL